MKGIRVLLIVCILTMLQGCGAAAVQSVSADAGADFGKTILSEYAAAGEEAEEKVNKEKTKPDTVYLDSVEISLGERGEVFQEKTGADKVEMDEDFLYQVADESGMWSRLLGWENESGEIIRIGAETEDAVFYGEIRCGMDMDTAMERLGRPAGLDNTETIYYYTGDGTPCSSAEQAETALSILTVYGTTEISQINIYKVQ